MPAGEFGVTYHPDHLSRFIRVPGFSRQKPVARARHEAGLQMRPRKRTWLGIAPQT